MAIIIDKSWTLFLDRDGIINDNTNFYYVTKWSEFIFKKNIIVVLQKYRQLFSRIIIVTNQQGVGKKVMSQEDLQIIHSKMLDRMKLDKILIDAIYSCKHLESENCICHKPRTGLALKAKEEFPDINFEQSVCIGDSIRDMQLGRALKMVTILVNKDNLDPEEYDYYCSDIRDTLSLLIS